MSTLQPGQHLNVVGGKYKGSTAIFVKYCNVKVRVQLLDSNGNPIGSDVCLMPTSIRAVDAPTRNDSPSIAPVSAANIRRSTSVQEHTDQVLSATATSAVPAVVVSMDRTERTRSRRAVIHSNVSPSLTDRSEHITSRRATVHSNVSPSPQYQRPQTPSSSYRRGVTHIPVLSSSVVVSDNDLFFDAEDDEEFFDAQQQYPRDDEAIIVADHVPSDRRIAPPAMFTPTLLPSDRITPPTATIGGVCDYAPVAPAVVSDDEESTAATSFMSIDDIGDDFDLLEEYEEESEDEPNQPLPPQHVIYQRPRFPRTEQQTQPGPPECYFEMDKIVMLPPGTTKKRNTFAHYLFEGRILEFEVPIKSSSKPKDVVRTFPTELSYGGCYWQLLSSKMHNSGSGQGGRSFQFTRRVGLFYAPVSGPNFAPIDLQEELEKIAAFSLLSTRKAIARLELFLSPARKSNRKGREFLIFDDLTSSDFESIPEKDNEGCGFIPRQYIERFLGSYAVGKRTFALQVRVFAPQLGIFKGVLMEKPGITKIQLPESMQKVLPSLVREANDWACLLVTSAGVHPNTKNTTRNNILNGKPAPKSWNGSQSKLSPMIMTLFESLNIPAPTMDAFAAQASRGRFIEHANVVGVADPTDALPAGHVFVTGLTEICKTRSLQHLFVTRFPCTEPADGRLLPIVTTKPDGMQANVWEWLTRLAFGAIIFAKPHRGCRPTPTTIAGGDLDGDLYFVTWNDGILTNLGTAVAHVERPPVEPEREDNQQSFETRGDNWLKDAQNQMADLFTVVFRQTVIGKLYKEWHKRVLQSDFGSDCFSFGEAFKQALDIGKHGGKVFLPRHLWQEIPETLHQFLSHS